MSDDRPPELRRALPLPLVILYGLGVTIGAGIYVLLGATAGKAGVHAPISFVIAAVVVAFSAASYGELAARFPVSAGEAAYVREGLRSSRLAGLVGLMVVLSGIVSSATITIGSIGYLRQFVNLPETALIVLVVVGVTAVAAWGIVESMLFAGIFTVVEAGALIVIIGAGLNANPGLIFELPNVLPDIGDTKAWAGVAAAGLLAFFAFIGFEDIVNLAEEVKEPERNLPRAIYVTLILSALIYFMVASVAVLSVPIGDLAQSRAPLSLVFSHVSTLSPATISAIAVAATLNGVIIQIVMASRVIYGLGRQGTLPAVFARVHPWTRTPVIATLVVAGAVMVLALTVPLHDLAAWTSRVVLMVFVLVNASLFALKRQGVAAPAKGPAVPTWVPVAGILSCLGLLGADLIG
ncbi:MAG: APC family permease [Proteobacteria bacterium]|nr:APC family permease [Pseudomonadota bacterium]